MGGAGGVETVLCASATEPNANPTAVILNEDEMDTGNTSAPGKATRMPFVEVAKCCNCRTFAQWRSPKILLADRNSRTCCADCGQMIPGRPGAWHLIS